MDICWSMPDAISLRHQFDRADTLLSRDGGTVRPQRAMESQSNTSLLLTLRPITRSMKMLRLLGYSGGLLLGVIVLSFFLFAVVPNDPARTMLGPNASEQSVQTLRNELGLNLPLWQQLAKHLGRTATLDLGRSVVDGRAVGKEVWAKFGLTAKIGLQASLISLCVSYVLNMGAFFWPPMGCLLPLVRLGIMAPAFLIATVGAILIGTFLPFVSLSAQYNGLLAPFLPSLIASFYPTALMTMILREKVVAFRHSSFFRAGMAAGHSQRSLFHRFMLKPAAVSWLAAWVNQLSIIFFATIVLEVIFSLPGSGVLLLNAIQSKDFPMLQGMLLANAAFFLGLSILSQFLYSRLNPRA
jgi:peptide/nickel transport system permease protein